MIEAFLFDIGDTLIHFETSQLGRMTEPVVPDRTLPQESARRDQVIGCWSELPSVLAKGVSHAA